MKSKTQPYDAKAKHTLARQLSTIADGYIDIPYSAKF